MKRIAVLTGSGISAESGIQTFRGNGGLWEGHDVTQVASPEGFRANPELVLRFYNERRRQVRQAQPNPGHEALVQLEEKYEVDIITQNIDDLHERAGSSRVLHLHGEILKGCSVQDHSCQVALEGDIAVGDLAPDGAQLRPFIVWFGEMVPMIEPAAELMMQADLAIIVGTSLVVYPAAGLVQYTRPNIPIYVVDPHRPEAYLGDMVTYVQEPASTGVPTLVQRLLEEA